MEKEMCIIETYDGNELLSTETYRERDRERALSILCMYLLEKFVWNYDIKFSYSYDMLNPMHQYFTFTIENICTHFDVNFNRENLSD